MYLESIALQNVGPIKDFDLALPFVDGLPKPVVLVGPNGSGKTTVLSFIVNALVAFKQQVFEESEVEQNKVYRVRGALFLRGGESYYHAKLQFAQGLSLEEWVIDRPRKRFEAEVSPLPIDEGWKNISDEAHDLFAITPNTRNVLDSQPNAAVEKLSTKT
jgi:energy-coupling factor transporter ATP-binding protein EcfA2